MNSRLFLVKTAKTKRKTRLGWTGIETVQIPGRTCCCRVEKASATEWSCDIGGRAATVRPLGKRIGTETDWWYHWKLNMIALIYNFLLISAQK